MKSLVRKLAAMLSVCALALAAHGQTPVFTYQGQLTDGGSPANGLFDLTFELFDDVSGGNSFGVITNNATVVTNGLFTVPLAYGAPAFDGGDRWLEIGVTTNGGDSFVLLSPRQPLTSAPYAIRAYTVEGLNITGNLDGTKILAGSVGASQLGANSVGPSELVDNAVSSAEIANGSVTANDLADNSVTSAKVVNGTLTEDDLGVNSVGSSEIQAGAVGSSELADGSVSSGDLDATLLNATFWRLNGNTGTTGGVHFLGTTDNQPVDLRVNDTRALRVAYPTSGSVPNIIGGQGLNSIGSNTEGAVIGGGGLNISPNSIGSDSDMATIGGGRSQTIGDDNFAATISGGYVNAISDDSRLSLIAGGSGNSIGTNAWWGAILGGHLNAVAANATYAIAAGRRAKANHAGSFVWADSLNADFTSAISDEFAVRAANGMRVVGDSVIGNLTVAPLQTGSGGDSEILLAEDHDGTYGMLWRYDGGLDQLQLLQKFGSSYTSPFITVGYYTARVGIGRTAAVNILEVEGNASKSAAGSWLANSDRRIKHDIQPIEGALDKINRVRLVDFTYSAPYRQRHPSIEDRRYVNVVAQEFAEVFPDHVKGSGEHLPNGEEILQVDIHPITIYSAAAIQELSRENQQLRDRIERLERLVEQRVVSSTP